MKTRFKILLSTLAAFAVLAAVHLPINGQQVQGPVVYSMLTNPAATPFIVVGGGTAPGPSTNLAGLDVRSAVPMGRGGYALLINCAGTNATTTTNLTITIEYSPNGTDWMTNDATAFITTPLGTQYAPFGTNNFQTDVSGVMGNFAAARVRSMHHTNTGSIFITNLHWMTR
jgi:hypothetical protein